MLIKPAPSLERVRELFYYHPDGYFIRKIALGRGKGRYKVGDVVKGTPNGNGYRRCRVDNELYLLHRLIYYWHTGEWPPEIDHRSGIIFDNRISNLRSADKSINQHSSGLRKDNFTGFRNISPHSDGGYKVLVTYRGADHSKYCATMSKALATRQEIWNKLGLTKERRGP